MADALWSHWGIGTRPWLLTSECDRSRNAAALEDALSVTAHMRGDNPKMKQARCRSLPLTRGSQLPVQEQTQAFAGAAAALCWDAACPGLHVGVLHGVAWRWLPWCQDGHCPHRRTWPGAIHGFQHRAANAPPPRSHCPVWEPAHTWCLETEPKVKCLAIGVLR